MTDAGSGAAGERSVGHVLARQPDLLDYVEQRTGVGIWEWIPERDKVWWSDNLFRIAGLKPREIEPSSGFFLDITHPDDRERHRREFARMERGGKRLQFEFRILVAGRVRHINSTVAYIDEGGPRQLVGVLEDLTERRRIERRIAAHQAVSGTLAGWSTFEEGARDLIGGLAAALGFVAGALWVPEGDALVPVVTWQEPGVGSSEFEIATRKLRVPRGTGIPGKAWETGQPVQVLDASDDPTYGRWQAAIAGELHGALALPIVRDREAIGVLDLYSRDRVEPTEELERSLVDVGREVGQFLLLHPGGIGLRPLTPREFEVLQLAARGRSGPQIAGQLGIGRVTVRTHFKHIYEKLDVHDRPSAVAEGLRRGLIS